MEEGKGGGRGRGFSECVSIISTISICNYQVLTRYSMNISSCAYCFLFVTLSALFLFHVFLIFCVLIASSFSVPYFRKHTFFAPCL